MFVFGVSVPYMKERFQFTTGGTKKTKTKKKRVRFAVQREYLKSQQMFAVWG